MLLHSWWTERREGERPSHYQVDPQRDAWETLQAFAADPTTGVGIARAIFDRAG